MFDAAEIELFARESKNDDAKKVFENDFNVLINIKPIQELLGVFYQSPVIYQSLLMAFKAQYYKLSESKITHEVNSIPDLSYKNYPNKKLLFRNQRMINLGDYLNQIIDQLKHGQCTFAKIIDFYSTLRLIANLDNDYAKWIEQRSAPLLKTLTAPFEEIIGDFFVLQKKEFEFRLKIVSERTLDRWSDKQKKQVYDLLLQEEKAQRLEEKHPQQEELKANLFFQELDKINKEADDAEESYRKASWYNFVIRLIYKTYKNYTGKAERESLLKKIAASREQLKSSGKKFYKRRESGGLKLARSWGWRLDEVALKEYLQKSQYEKKDEKEDKKLEVKLTQEEKEKIAHERELDERQYKVYLRRLANTDNDCASIVLGKYILADKAVPDSFRSELYDPENGFTKSILDKAEGWAKNYLFEQEEAAKSEEASPKIRIVRVNSDLEAFQLKKAEYANLLAQIKEFQLYCANRNQFFRANPNSSIWSDQDKFQVNNSHEYIKATFEIILNKIKSSSLTLKQQQQLIFKLQSGRYDLYWHKYAKYYLGDSSSFLPDSEEIVNSLQLFLEQTLDEQDKKELIELGAIVEPEKSANAVMFTRSQIDGKLMLVKKVQDLHLLLNECHNSGLFRASLGERSANWVMLSGLNGNVQGEVCEALPGFIDFQKLSDVAQAENPNRVIIEKINKLVEKIKIVEQKIRLLESNLPGVDKESKQKAVNPKLIILRAFKQELLDTFNSWQAIAENQVIDFNNHKVDLAKIPEVVAQVLCNAFYYMDWDRHKKNWGLCFRDGKLGVASIDYDKSLNEHNTLTHDWSISAQKLLDFPAFEGWYWPASASYAGFVGKFKKGKKGYTASEAADFRNLKNNPQFREQCQIEFFKDMFLTKDFYLEIHRERLGHAVDEKLDNAANMLEERRQNLMDAMAQLNYVRQMIINKDFKLIDKCLLDLEKSLGKEKYKKFVVSNKDMVIKDLETRCRQVESQRAIISSLIIGKDLIKMLDKKGLWFSPTSNERLSIELTKIVSAPPATDTIKKIFGQFGVEFSDTEIRSLKQLIYREMLKDFNDIIPAEIRIKKHGLFGCEFSRKGIEEFQKTLQEYIHTEDDLTKKHLLAKAYKEFIALGIEPIDAALFSKKFEEVASVAKLPVEIKLLLDTEIGKNVISKLTQVKLLAEFYKLITSMKQQDLKILFAELNAVDSAAPRADFVSVFTKFRSVPSSSTAIILGTAGAAIGTAITPGVGTIIGGGIGAAAGVVAERLSASAHKKKTKKPGKATFWIESPRAELKEEKTIIHHKKPSSRLGA